MEIVNTTKFAIGIALALAGVAVFFLARGERGFGQRKQIGAILLLGGAAFVGVGLGLIDL